MIMNNYTLAIIIPLYNEEKIIPLLYRRLLISLDQFSKFRIIFVNDGSTDNTLPILAQYLEEDYRITIINLSRNFGHQSAIMAGINNAHADILILMDGDLQDPPELIPRFIDEWKKGYEIVVANRRSRNDPLLRKIFFNLFYRALKYLSDFPGENVGGTYCLLDKKAAIELSKLNEHNRYIPGLRSWIGFKQTAIWYDREERYTGAPKQTIKRLFVYGFNAIFSFSYKPLRITWIVGLLISMCAFIYGFVLLILRLLNINVVSGFTTLAVAIFFIGGVQLIMLGILGEYVIRIYDETKARPDYIISDILEKKY